MCCWRPSCAHHIRGRAGCRVPGSSGGCRRAPNASWCWSAGPPGSASRACWPTGRAATDRPVAWLSLDAGDNDPVRFWRHVVAALDGVHPGVAERVGPLVPGAAATPFAGAVTALVNELAAAADEVVLVLDDYHLVEAPEVHGSLEFLLEHLPPALHLVLASRSDPPLPLARLRARGQLAELRAADLRFTAERGRASCCAPRSGTTCPTASSRRWASAPRAGPPGCSWRRCRCGAAAMSPGSSRRSPAATGTCWTTWPRRCSSASPRSCGRSCWRPRCWSGCAARCATRSPAAPTARSCWSRWSGPACSWSRWTRCAAGGATTTCSPICCAPACSGSTRTGCPSCTARRRPGTSEHGLADDAIRHALAAGDTARAAELVEEHLEEQVWRRAQGATIAAGWPRCRPRRSTAGRC